MNPWLFVFLVSTVLFMLLVDWRSLTHNLWAGFVCLVYQFGIETVFRDLSFIHHLRVGEGLPDLFLFSNRVNVFYFGIVFTMGILFVQFLPRNYFLQLIHASIWLVFFRLMNQIAEYNNMIEFVHWEAWKPFHIIPGNMLALAWLKNIISEGDISKNYEAIRRSAAK